MNFLVITLKFKAVNDEKKNFLFRTKFSSITKNPLSRLSLKLKYTLFYVVISIIIKILNENLLF